MSPIEQGSMNVVSDTTFSQFKICSQYLIQ